MSGASEQRCGACGNADRTFAFTGHDWYIGTVGGSYDYWRCLRCDSVYVDPQPTDEQLDAAYAASYGPYRERPSLIERLGEPLAQREASRLATVADRRDTVVDVGCGGGAMLRRLRAAGWSGPMRGVEPAPDVAARTRAALGIRVDVAPVETLPIDPESAGTIVLRHVIEHVREPLAVLETIRASLRPGGHLYLATPDRRALAARIFGRHWHGYDPPRHLYCFTSHGVRTLLASAGFQVVEERWDFSPQMWSASLHHRLRDSRLQRWADPLSTLVNPVVALPASIGGLLETVLHRSTMYGVIARRGR